jgi:protein-L-isoaspartate(D-aspartate) O-methyltransferase
MPIDFNHARHAMVEQQVRPWEVLDSRVLDVLGKVRREDFVPVQHRKLAFTDLPLPLEHGEFMMKPVIEGRLLQALDVAETDEVLEIGSGTGFLTACLAQLARSVHAIELHADFVTAAQRRLAERGITNARLECADAAQWKTTQRFDAILVGGAVATLPESFVHWLKPGGRLVLVRGNAPVQEAICLRNDTAGRSIDSLFETDIPYLRGFAPEARFTL